MKMQLDVSREKPAKRKMKAAVQQDRIVVLCLLFSSFALVLWLTDAWPSATHDGLIHMHRIRALADALRAGVLYPRWFPDYSFGYGYPVLNYYPPLFYYPSALLNLAGLDMVASLRLPIAVGFALSALWMFRLARRFFTVWPAAACTICYQFHPYRMIDLFERGAFPELTAFMWLPLVSFYGIQAVAALSRQGNGATVDAESSLQRARAYGTLLAKAGLAFGGLILMHHLTALMTVMVFAIVLALLALQRYRVGAVSPIRAGLTMAGFGAVGILLTSWSTLPVLLEINWVDVSKGVVFGGWMYHMAGWNDLFEPALIYSYNYPHYPTFFLPIYTIPIGVFAFYVFAASKARNLRLFTFVVLSSTILAVWLTTAASYWLWASFEFLFEKLQFPWRWQLFVAFGTSLLLAVCLEQLQLLRRLPAYIAPIVFITLSTYIVFYSTVGLDYPTDDDFRYKDLSAPALWQWNSQSWELDSEGNGIGSWPREFMPVWVDVDPRTIGGPPWEELTMPDSIETLAVVPVRSGLLQHRFQVTTQQAFRLLFHQFYFPPWRVSLDGKQAKVEPAGQLALASVQIPPGTHDVVFAWGSTRSVWLGRLLTAVGWSAVFALLYLGSSGAGTVWPGRKPSLWAYRRYLPLGGWLAIGALMVVAASGITDRTWEVSAIGADYENVRLEGVRPPPPTRSGEVAAVRLWWSVKTAGVPVSAFVHLVDETGMGVSQHDGPPGGQYTPYQRWGPGLVLNSTHYITVPETLSPGTYRLVAGLYLPDISHEPLVPLNGGNARLEIGTLEVLPK
ncbi:MAG: hypothetical protein OXH73_11400 [Caldilineaceae bacterium]|nr:hypothetical protein [Caldilineaceae bacterium]